MNISRKFLLAISGKKSSSLFNGPVCTFPSNGKSAEEHLEILAKQLQVGSETLTIPARVNTITKIHIFNKVAAAAYAPPESTATIAIRITDHNTEFLSGFNYDLYEDVLEVRFQDSDPTYLFTKSLSALLFTEANAKSIYDFIKKQKKACELIIHCDYGQSRSPATALAIAKYILNRNNDDDIVLEIDSKIEDGTYSPNEWILHEQEKYFKKFNSN